MNDPARESLPRPWRSDSFRVEIDGASIGGFAACTGLEAHREVLVWAEGGREAPRLFPGERASLRVVLERGLAHDRALWEWFVAADPRDASVVLLDESGREVRRWELASAWPCRWLGPELVALADRVAIERLEIVCEELRCL